MSMKSEDRLLRWANSTQHGHNRKTGIFNS